MKTLFIINDAPYGTEKTSAFLNILIERGVTP
jgi:hypothetical protein